MSKKYRLLKDLPDVKAGEIFTRRDGDEQHYWGQTKCSDGAYSRWPIFYVESNPSWWQEVVEREWEIVEASIDPEDQTKGKILSVKRLSDNEVFSVGDETTQDEIKSFEAKHDIMYVHYKNGGWGYLSVIKKATPQQSKQPERIEVEITSGNNGKASTVNTIHSNKRIPIEKLPAIKQAIEDVLNEPEVKPFCQKEFDVAMKEAGSFFKNSHYLTTAQLNEEREKAFNMGRELAAGLKSADERWVYNMKYPTFQDYLNSIK